MKLHKIRNYVNGQTYMLFMYSFNKVHEINVIYGGHVLS
jgi:hypothetical protein